MISDKMFDEGDYVVSFIKKGIKIEDRIMIVTKNIKKTIKEYKNKGYMVFGMPLLYKNYEFLAINEKSLTIKKRKGRMVVIDNAMFFISKVYEKGNLIDNR